MITDRQRKIVIALVKLNVWRLERGMFGQIEVRSSRGTKWLFNRMRKNQMVDDLHHAPACPANHYHKTRLVFHRCNCGAEHYAKEEELRG
jgi:hypothetical protein